MTGDGPQAGPRHEPEPIHERAMIRSALLQDAEVIVLGDFEDRPEIAAFSGVGVILRY